MYIDRWTLQRADDSDGAVQVRWEIITTDQESTAEDQCHHERSRLERMQNVPQSG